MAKITTPVEGFNGIVAGVHFADGVGETDDPAALFYFERRGYGIEGEESPENDVPTEKWKGDDIDAWAAKQEPAIDISAAKNKAEKVAIIAAALSDRSAASSGAQE